MWSYCPADGLIQFALTSGEYEVAATYTAQLFGNNYTTVVLFNFKLFSSFSIYLHVIIDYENRLKKVGLMSNNLGQ